MVMIPNTHTNTHAHTQTQVQRLVGSTDRMGTNGQTDGRTDDAMFTTLTLTLRLI